MATIDTPILTSSADLVTYVIKAKGEKIPKEFHVLSVTVENGVNKIPRATVVLADGDPSLPNFEVSDKGMFSPGNEIEIELGYMKNDKAENTGVFKGLITKNSHKISDNYSELTIECKHAVDLLTYTKVNHIPDENSLDSDMIEFVLDKHRDKLPKFDVKPTTEKHPQVVQVNTTDWDFIMSRVDIGKLICTFPESKISITEIPVENPQIDSEANTEGAAPGQTPETDFDLIYGRNILEFDGELDARIDSSAVKVLTWNYKTQEVEESKSETEDPTGNDSEDKKKEEEAAKKLGYEWVISTPAHKETDESVAIAFIKKARQRLSKIKGSVKYLGTTKLLAGSFVKIKGVGKKFDGKAFVSNILHEYSDGCWITTATLGWDEKLFTEQTNGHHPTAATGQASSIQGLQIGKVTKIEDADGDYRVKVKLPMVDKASEGIYARVATLDAGKDRGTFFRPEEDDEVVIGFMADDPSNPVILGCLHSSKLKSPLEPEKNNHKKGYVSRSAIKLLFDDDQKSLTIETPGNRVFEMNDKEGTFSMKDEFGNKIIMEKSGITIDSAGDITLKAKKKLSAEAGTQLEMKANSTANLEGNGPVTVKSSGNTIIKGSKVMIN